MVGFIYKYENRVNHKVYIGQTVDLVSRQYSHKCKAQTVKNKFYNAVRKYGWDNFNFSVIAQVEAETLEEVTKLLDCMEEKYIEEYDSFKNGYNSTTGGHACRGKEMPESFIEKCRNRKYSEETRRKMSESHKKVVYTPERRQKLREAALKRNFASYREKTTEKRVAGIKKAKSKAVLQIDESGKVVNEFFSMQDAVNYIRATLAKDKTEYGIWNGMHRHCNGKIKKRYFYGFEWKFKANV